MSWHHSRFELIFIKIKTTSPKTTEAPSTTTTQQKQQKMAVSIHQQQLDETQLKNLLLYKYTAQDRSLTYRYLLSPLYSRLVTLLPIWLAPNLVTLIGFIFPLMAHLLLIYHSPTLLNDKVPSYIHLFSGISLLFYMVMDNLDGKQARRTKSSSPLGHLFDHACDCLNITISGLSLLVCVRLNNIYMVMSVMFNIGYLMFYMSVIEEFHTGCMILREINGPNEGLLFLSIVHFITFFKTHSFWSQTTLFNFPLNEFLYWFSFIPTIHTISANIHGIVQHRQSSTSLVTVLKRMSPIAMIALIQFGTVNLEIHGNVRLYIVPLLWQTGLTVYDMVTRIMIATLTKSSFPLDSSFPNMFIPMLVAHLAVIMHENPFWVIWSCVICSLIYCALRAYFVITEITQFLNISCFSLVKYKMQNKKKQNKFYVG